MIIFGAGLSGLLAGALDRNATILERQTSLPNNHHAVLRFRSDKIARALDLPFRKVHVIKAVTGDDYNVRHVATPADVNGYSKKTIGTLSSRSIVDLAPCERYIAPPNLVELLSQMCKDRIKLGVDVDGRSILKGNGPFISTIPLPIMMGICGMDTSEFKFEHAPIRIMKGKIKGADIFQTIYFTGGNTPLYRATITGDEIIFELSGRGALTEYNLTDALGCFALDNSDVEWTVNERQRYGKISPLHAPARRSILYQLTRDHSIYSLGRFACWRNTLLDDVFEDYYKIRSMIGLEKYEQLRRAT